MLEIEYPGTWLKLADKDKGWQVQQFISFMEDALMDMAITLSMFDESQQRLQIELEEASFQWEQNQKLRMAIDNNYRCTLPDPDDYYRNYDAHSTEVEKRYRAAKQKAGEVPNSYKTRYPFIHAHGFLAGADTFSKFLGVICEETKLPVVTDLHKELHQALPALRDVRNSSQHMEDRNRGYGKPADVQKKIRMDLKPIDNNVIKAEGGALALSNLNGNKLGYTVKDGFYQEFEISLHTLVFITDIFQRLINSFQWNGPPSTEPRF